MGISFSSQNNRTFLNNHSINLPACFFEFCSVVIVWLLNLKTSGLHILKRIRLEMEYVLRYANANDYVLCNIRPYSQLVLPFVSFHQSSRSHITDHHITPLLYSFHWIPDPFNSTHLMAVVKSSLSLEQAFDRFTCIHKTILC